MQKLLIANSIRLLLRLKDLHDWFYERWAISDNDPNISPRL